MLVMCWELEKSKFVTRSKTRGTEHQSILIPNKYENKNLILSRDRPGTFLCACFTTCNLPNIWLFYIFSEAVKSWINWPWKLYSLYSRLHWKIFTSDHWQLVDTDSCVLLRLNRTVQNKKWLQLFCPDSQYFILHSFFLLHSNIYLTFHFQILFLGCKLTLHLLFYLQFFKECFLSGIFSAVLWILGE